MKITSLWVLITLVIVSAAPIQAENPSLSARTKIRPNVLVIMADDLGYNDLGYQGSSVVKTPHIDALAKSGVIFSDAHTTASVCSPSRAGFITGRYQQRFGHEANCPPSGFGMDTSEYTIGEAFQSLGYKSYLVGKWHLGDTKEQYPTQRGFDEFWGLREGSRSFFHSRSVDKPGNSRAIELNGKQVDFKGFLTDRMTDQAIRMIDSDKEKPFFMFLSYTAPHAPLQATPEDLARANNNAYHALIQNMDDNIGRLVGYLDTNKLKEKTMIWFLSDNGGTVKHASNRPLNGKKGIKFEGGQRVPFILNWPGSVPGGVTFNGLTSALDIFATSFKAAGGIQTPKPLDGIDLVPFLNGRVGDPHDTLCWRKLEGKAVRSGDWKMIITEGLDPMLYNLDKDISERNNIAESKPEVVEQLRKKLTEWESEMITPKWGEGDKWVNVRKKDYIRFRDAKGSIKL